jgi:hypothetical protein
MADLGAITTGWEIIEKALQDAGMTGPPLNVGIPFKSRAEQVSKAIVARLANNDPPILLVYGHELCEHNDLEGDSDG